MTDKPDVHTQLEKMGLPTYGTDEEKAERLERNTSKVLTANKQPEKEPDVIVIDDVVNEPKRKGRPAKK